MFKGQKVLGVIPARSGSKSIPFKNIYPINGKPLIYYIIQTAKEAKEKGILTRFIVSTDNKEIAEIAKKFGAEVPFLRPKEFALDDSSDIEFMKHALMEMEKLGFKADILVNLRPTSPFLRVSDIKKAIDILIKAGADSVRSVSHLEHNCHPYWLKRIEGSKAYPFLEGFDEKKYFNRQTLPPLYRLNAAVDVSTADTIRKGDLYGNDMRVYIMDDPISSLDINSKLDFLIAEAILANRLTK